VGAVKHSSRSIPRGNPEKEAEGRCGRRLDSGGQLRAQGVRENYIKGFKPNKACRHLK
jgi:hypothetical protein